MLSTRSSTRVFLTVCGSVSYDRTPHLQLSYFMDRFLSVWGIDSFQFCCRAMLTLRCSMLQQLFNGGGVQMGDYVLGENIDGLLNQLFQQQGACVFRVP